MVSRSHYLKEFNAELQIYAALVQSANSFWAETDIPIKLHQRLCYSLLSLVRHNCPNESAWNNSIRLLDRLHDVDLEYKRRLDLWFSIDDKPLPQSDDLPF